MRNGKHGSVAKQIERNGARERIQRILLQNVAGFDDSDMWHVVQIRNHQRHNFMVSK